MKKIRILLLGILIPLLITSCKNHDFRNYYEFEILNNPADGKPVYVELSCPYNYTINNNGDEIVEESFQGKDTILQMQPSSYKRILFQMEINDNSSFTGDYKKDGIVPVWEYIKSIKVGDEVLKEENWKNSNRWNHEVGVEVFFDDIYVTSRYQLQLGTNVSE